MRNRNNPHVYFCEGGAPIHVHVGLQEMRENCASFALVVFRDAVRFRWALSIRMARGSEL